MYKIRFFAFLAILLTLGFSVLVLLPDTAEAQRIGGGSSMGSRGSRSVAAPRTVTPPMSTSTAAPMGAAAAPSRSGGMSSGLMGGLGGLVVGGILGSMLFGGGGGGGGEAAAGAASGGGIGLLEILLLAGLAWFAFRWFKQQQEKKTVPAEGLFATQRAGMTPPLAGNFPFGNGSDTAMDSQQHNLQQGLQNIASMDPRFDQNRFLEGAKMAFQQIQSAWGTWQVEQLRPLLTEQMWQMVQNQANTRKAAGLRDMIENIRFDEAVISEAWQETGEDWITVHFVVELTDYTTGVDGKVVEGDPKARSKVEEYWTFTRPVGSQNPNWFLTAIQQPGEVVKSVH